MQGYVDSLRPGALYQGKSKRGREACLIVGATSHDLEQKTATYGSLRRYWRAAPLSLCRRPNVHPMKHFLFAAGIFAAALIIFVFATRSAPPAAYRVGQSGDEHVAIGFLQPEANPEGAYRWTDGDSLLRFSGYEPAQLLLAGVTITGAEGSTTGEPALWFESGGQALAGFRPPPTRRVYSVLLPAASGWRAPELRLRSTTFQPRANDQRLLGVVVHGTTTRALGEARLAPRIERAAYFAVLVALVFVGALGITRLGYALALALTLVALLAATLLLDPAGSARRFPPLWTLAGILAAGATVLWAAGRLRRSIVRPVWWASAGLVLGFAGQVLLREQIVVPAAALLLLIGATLVAAACTRDASPEKTATTTAAIHLDAPLLGLCLLIALALRLIALDSVPFGLWRDEARHGLLALQILDDPTYRPIYVPGAADIPALLFYLQTLPIALFGPTVPAVRLVSALAGSLTVVPIYFLGRFLLGREVGLVAAFLLAVSSWHIALSRLAFAAVLDPLFTLSALALLAHITGRRSTPGTRRLVVEALLAGVCAGLALNTYHSARMMPLAVVAVVLVGLGRDAQAWRRAAPGLLAFATAAVVVALPLLWYITTQPGGFNRRVAQVGFLSPNEERPTYLQGLEYNAVRYLLMWNVAGEPNARHHPPDVPMLDPLTGLCFTIGVIALARVGRPRERLLLVLLLIGLLPGLLSSDAPHAVRTVAAIPPTLLIAASFAVRLGQLFAAWARPRRLYPTPAAALLGSAICAFNVWVYFGHVPYDPRVWDKFEYVTATMIGAYVQQLPGAEEPLVPLSIAETDAFRYLSYGHAVQVFTPEDTASVGRGPALLPVDADEPTGAWVRGWAGTAGMPRPMRPYPGTDKPTFWVYPPAAAEMP